MNNNTRKKILFTGGGSAGHVMPNLALIKKFQEADWEIFYIGSKAGIEKTLLIKANIPYFAIATGKLRRYFSWQNFFDPIKIIYGFFQSILLCLKLRPDIIFSKGGFVAFPVVVAGWLCRIPVVAHESDLSIGLANKLSLPFVKKVCLTFLETAKYLKQQGKYVITGTPIRQEFFTGDAKIGREICGFTSGKKIILVFGGSLGAAIINQVVRELLPGILSEFSLVHVCGENKVDVNLNYPDYKQFEFLYGEFPHVLKAADLVISRAGANTIYELLVLRKPHILIPLGSSQSRGDQQLNAKISEKYGYSQIILETELTKELLLQKISWVFTHYAEVLTALAKFEKQDSVELIYELIVEELK